MGFYVSSLGNLPSGSIEYFVYVVDASTADLHSDWIHDNLAKFGATFGPAAGLVTGPDDLSKEVFQFLSAHLLEQDFCSVEGLLHSATCLLISEGSLLKTQNAVYLIPVAQGIEKEAVKDRISALISEIAKALTDNRLQKVMSSSDARELQLKNSRGRLWVSELNESLELKPNIFGIGINLNKLIKKLFPSQ